MDSSSHQFNPRRTSDKAHTILCIDDESANLKVLSSIFRDHYTVILTKNAEQGYQKALEIIPDLILLDVVMPDENGFELIKKIKASHALAHIPVIFITGLHGEDDEAKGLKLGACDYIHKPFSHSIIFARVNTHLEIVRQRKLLEKFANFDSLTELPNRRKWQTDSHAVWQNAMINQQKINIGVVDVDHFKKYNDFYGHVKGDIVLRKISNAVKRALYQYDGCIYRCGGEEFYFYFPENTQILNEDVLATCQQAVNDLAIPHQTSPVQPYLTISIGAVNHQPCPNSQLLEVIDAADRLLYQAKHNGRNRYAYGNYSI
ncbi:diguanylate cyclase response regulator [Saccharobesus litoralis]|uniref:diguanylate cyclase n=1 Tax=Saccharobesus litoralis TaxID=2172099 RepID=A0A2S0VWF2_9ALTE|nr:diguanylate cyclase [Saccharobesus litoralis]AWB68549.1 diguanylate cyclase response regulator [Saccharobesus litoralis]